MKQLLKYIFPVLLISIAAFVTASDKMADEESLQLPDTEVSQESESPELKHPLKKESTNPNLNDDNYKGIDLKTPSNIEYKKDYNPETGEITIYQKVGNIDVQLPYTMSMEEYLSSDIEQSMKSYWRLKTQGETSGSGNALLDKALKLGKKGGLFGSDFIKIKPQGTAELKIGVSHTNIDNPALQEQQRSTTTFDFEEKIQMNITGTIGNKLSMAVKYDTEATFEFDNEMKLEYKGEEDEILKTVEAGNVTLPLPGTLITGSQSLFGVKTEMQFGKLNVTSIFSQQKGQASSISVEGGAQTSDFDVPIDKYDKNRHFFLTHEFRDQFEKALGSLPLLTSNIEITNIEVWISNKGGNFEEARNVVAFSDLAEPRHIHNTILWTGNSSFPSAANDANDLYENYRENSGVRDFNSITSTLSNLKSTEYDKIESARKLSPSEYTLNSKLGFLSLNSTLNSDDILAVAFEFTYLGKPYSVGELSNSGVESDKTLILKLLKGTNLTPSHPTWDLMMKNIYSLGAYQVNRDDFYLDIVLLDETTGGYINYLPEDGIKEPILLRMLNLDQMNSQLDPQPDGVFDFIEDITITPNNGRVIFPVLEPFGSYLESAIGNKTISDKYVFKELYTETITQASKYAEKNKFRLQGSYKSASGSEISLGAMDIPQGSVIVTAGGIKLQENVDYTVDYTLGRVRIINSGILESGTPINVSLESRSFFNLQTKTMMGVHMNYQFNDNFNLGATVMHLSERPLTQKVSFGDEPISNTIWGLNGSYFRESQLITKMLDKLPLIQTKEPSSISIEGEFAHLIPGHPDVINAEGSTYIDDFEGTKMTYDLSYMRTWQLASTPQDPKLGLTQSNYIDDERDGYKRAQLAWFTIEPNLVRKKADPPANVSNDELSDHFVREVYEQELFPLRDHVSGQQTNLPILNLSYYPNERGPYNFSRDIEDDGNLRNPEYNWGGIMRSLQQNDFESANVEYIEFWLMDPYANYDENDPNSLNNPNCLDPNEKGELYFNLGNISEDILRDSRKSFEQGLPIPGGDQTLIDKTNLAIVPTGTNLVNGFSGDGAARKAQDIGLDGRNDEAEAETYEAFITDIHKINPNIIIDDPASDNFRFFRESYFDDHDLGILDRYKYYNNPEGNSTPDNNSRYSTTSTSSPDMEDINKNNTLDENESYFQYKISLAREDLKIGQNFIVDVRKDTVPQALPNNEEKQITWYQFRVPIAEYEDKYGDIEDFTSIRFMRMFLKNCTDTTLLRFATLDLVRADWRRYDFYNSTEPDTVLAVSAINIEENAERAPVNYMLPPGVDRVTDPNNPQLRELNEQSLSLKVTDMPIDEERAVYKNIDMDLRQFKKLKMWLHAEAIEGKNTEDELDGRVYAFIRLGTDFQKNYYEYAIPLKMTAHGFYRTEADKYEVWPEENEMNINLDWFHEAKLERNDKIRGGSANTSFTTEYSSYRPDDANNEQASITVMGNPNLSNVRSMMIGVRSAKTGQMKSFEVWANELRLTGFDEEGGWAATARINMKLADLGSLSLAGNTSTAGFGSLDKSVTERSQEDFYQYDIATSLELGKFIGPESRLSIPFYYGYSQAISTPKYYPVDPDIPLQIALDQAESENARDSIKELSQDFTERKSINFTNVKLKEKGDKTHFYSPSNLSATYAYNETFKRNVNVEHSIDKNYKGLLAYNYNARPKVIEPFKKSKLFKAKPFQLIRDFNFYPFPNQIGYKWEIMRDYYERKLRVLNKSDVGITVPVTVEKDFLWNKNFNLRYNITKSLKFDFDATTNSRIDEDTFNIINSNQEYYEDWKNTVINNISKFGRKTNYKHNLNLNYTIPIKKIPLLDWTNASLRYSGMYMWTAAPLMFDENSYNWGNTIKNSNNIQLNSQLNMRTLYNKVDYLKDLNRKYSNTKRKTSKTVRHNENIDSIKAKETIVINHKLKTTNVTVRVYDKSGKPATGETKVVGNNKVEFTPENDLTNARVMVTGTIEEKNTPFTVALDYSAMLLTSVKNVTISYREENGTILPGYMGDTDLNGMFGLSESLNGPGLPFILGLRNDSIIRDFGNKSLLTGDSEFSGTVKLTHSENFSIKTTIEPIKDLKIDLNAERRHSINNSYSGINQPGYTPITSGQFSMTYNIIGTAFESVSKDGDYQSDAFDAFKANRSKISKRLAQTRTPGASPIPDSEFYNGYSASSQEVLIPAFLSAYSGASTSSIFTNPFPALIKIQPNWRVTYDGLSKVKFFKKYVRSFNLTHAYRSTYNVGSYNSNSGLDFDNENIISTNQAGDYISEFQINSVTLTEQFSPLIQLSITWKNNLTTKAEIKKSRNLTLNMANIQLVETHNDEYVIGLGYRFDNFGMILKTLSGTQKKLNNDLNLRADFSIRDNITILRRPNENLNQMSSGQRISSLKITADYTLSKSFTMMAYYDQRINTPYVTVSYQTSNTEFGVSFRFSLTQ